jgi:two-component system, NtrC family, response regulator HupR/HoxA
MKAPVVSRWTPEGPGRVLVVDDEPSARLALAAVLADDFEVRLAEDVRAATQLLRAGDVEVLLTDFQMPRASGLELARTTAVAFPAVVTLLLTGHSDEPEVRLAQRDGRVFEVLLKPYVPSTLVRWVASAVKVSRLRLATQRLRVRM